MSSELSISNKKVNPHRKLTKSQGYILYFFFFSFFGWVLETIYGYLVLGHFTNRGFLYGPVCPIYGFGGILLLTFLKTFKKNPIKLAIYSIIVFSMLEYLLGYATDALFKIRLWDYSDRLMNINGRISLFFSVSWGVIALLFVYSVMPLLEKITKKLSAAIPVIVQIVLMRILSVIFFIDILYSFIEYSNINI